MSTSKNELLQLLSEPKYDSELSIQVMDIIDGENPMLKCYFGFLLRSGSVTDTTHKYCNECLKQEIITRYSLRTSSGNLIGHLKSNHKIKIHSSRIDTNQRKISDMLLNTASTISTVPKCDKRYLLARQLCLCFCRDLIPFSNSNKDGMNDFFRWAKVINQDENLPDRKSLANAALNDIYSVVYVKVQEIVRASHVPNVLNVSFDFWSDNIDPDFVMQNVCLKTEYFPHPHTGEEIAKAFEDVKSEFGLKDKKFRGCTDNGSNVKKASEILDFDWDSCLAHDLNLLVATNLLEHDDMEEVRSLIHKMKQINKTLMFRYEDMKKMHDDEYNKTLHRILSELENISDLLETTEVLISDFDIDDDDVDLITRFCNDQRRSNTTFTTTKNSNATRWNSVLTMFNSFDKNIDVVNNCLWNIKPTKRHKSYHHLIISDEEHRTIKEFIEILQIFEKATDMFQGSNYPTLNMTMIFYIETKDRLNELLRDKKLSKLAKRAVQIILDAFDKRFKVNDNMILASFLDPSMQHLQIIKDHFNDKDVDVDDALYEKWSNYELTAAGEVVSLNQKQSDKKVVPKSAGSDVKRIRLELIEKHCSVS
ncbi:E3 SUMO-protein ligase ZBED1, partial [Pseudolycoriella hygida]